MANLKVEMLPVRKLVAYENNAKIHTPEQVEQIKNSIKEFGFNDPIAVWENERGELEIVEGHGRLIAARELGMGDVPTINLNHMTDEQRRAYTHVHNQLTMNTGFDLDALVDELGNLDFEWEELGFDLDFLLGSDRDSGSAFETPDEVRRLTDDFVEPPFSVLDTGSARWMERKRAWREKMGDLSETRDGEFGKFSGNAGLMEEINGATSNFDPVLAECMFRWFCPDGGKVLDPFGGEQTKGYVAGALGLEYHACEIRQDQVDVDNKATAIFDNVHYYCGDSCKIEDIIKERGFDMCFTSPPYYDLEVYSKEDMSALGTYDEFMAMYRDIFQACYNMMNDHSFLVVKVGEIRDRKSGIYRGFVPDNIKCMEEIGFSYYNELTLISPAGTAPVRARRSMKNRKVVKLHQNVLVFYKGDVSKISEYFPAIEFEEEEQ